MTPAVRRWVEEIVKENELRDMRTLDIGAYDVNGCVRDLFTDYLGLDQRPGPNVDIVANANSLPLTFMDERFEVVLCLEMLEHDPHFWESVHEMARVLKRGSGHLILTTRGIGYPKHDEPHDYWRFTEHSIRLLLKNVGLTIVRVIEDEIDRGVMAHARRFAGWGQANTENQRRAANSTSRQTVR